MVLPSNLELERAIHWFNIQHRKNYGADTISELPPRVLTLRDSPVKCFVDNKLPEQLIHDYYLALVMDYFKTEAQPILERWMTNNDMSLEEFISQLYAIYQTIENPLKMPLLINSPLSSPKLKTHLKQICSRNLLTTLASGKAEFDRKRDAFYLEGFALFETRRPCWVPELLNGYDTRVLYEDLESDIPYFTDAATLSNQQLQAIIERIISSGAAIMMDEDPPALDDALISFKNTCHQIHALGLTADMTPLVQNRLQEKLTLDADWVDDIGQESILDDTMLWTRQVLLPWLSFIWLARDIEEEQWYDFLRAKIKVEHLARKIFFDTRLSRIFDIITEYPASESVVLDLKRIACKKRPEKLGNDNILLHRIKEAVLKEFQARLLKLSVWPTAILQQCVLCVQCLRELDPSCDILLPIIDSVRTYLRTKRNDAVAAVVDMIREGEEYGLSDDDIYTFKEGELEGKEEMDERERLRRIAIDPTAILISMCGSAAGFVKAYQAKLSKELFMVKDYDTDEEMAKLELLKQRFPANTMMSCDIMLKDLAESKRIDRQIHDDNVGVQDTFHGMVLSRHYWPRKNADDEDDEDEDEDPEKPVQLHPEIVQSMERFEAQFRGYKTDRKLKWSPTQGCITVELEFGDRTAEFRVDSIKALVISVFNDSDQAFTDDQIAETLNVDVDLVLEALEFWEKEGVLELTSDGVFRVLDEER
ncbi:hypothetical protein O0I10_002773 [Lichtheimia ornata]|uniref:Cullin family profile domain-containing protein n=1 Tax=Lichtheimia ornata TaxID=688661 RepID=A0AAD7Y2N2_9FUNG|nr:uncharacterized protein O0I10_002773 [Lichtheimia ornata]KAJ8661507.1 hypothetical protein O0I10_002773 [Lichtheimia ornata]